METVLQDLRYACRSLARARGFTAVAVLTLALGIGANSAIFTVVNGVLLRALPYSQPDELVRVDNENRKEAVNSGSFSRPDFQDFQTESGSVFAGVAGFFHIPALTSARLEAEGRPVSVSIAYVTGGFFDVLGIPATRGRAIGAADDVEGSDHVVVLSDAAWKARFNSDARIVGRTIRLDNEAFLVVGVMPASFAYPHAGVEIWAPAVLLGADRMGDPVRNNRWLSVIARVKPGVTTASAGAMSSQVLSRLEQAYPATNTDWGLARVRPLHEVVTGDVRPALVVLLGVVAFVLLIACANLANLLLARSTARVREIAVRTALGASRARIIRLVMTESIVLALVGGIAGLALSVWAVRVLVAMAGETIPRSESIRPDITVIVFTLLLTLITGLLFGLFPAMRSASGATAARLRDGGRTGTAGHEPQRARSALVVVEAALAVVLLVSAGLMIRSFYVLTHVDPGFNVEETVRINIAVPTERFDAQSMETLIEQMSTYMRAMFDAIESVPGVVAVGSSKTAPLQGGAEPYGVALPGAGNEEDLQKVGAYIVTPGFFDALDIPIVRGADWNWTDRRSGVIISNALATRLWPSGDAVGEQILVGGRPAEVVGVAGDIRNEGLAAEQTSAVYVPMFSAPRGNQNLFIRVNGNASALIPALREAVWSVDPGQAIRSSTTMRDVRSSDVARPQFFMTLIAAFGALALVLAAVGMYGVISYTTRQRTTEIGIRMALGANAAEIYRLVVGKAMVLALLGVSAGIVGALMLTQFMRSMLFGVAATNIPINAAASISLLTAAFVAAFLPAWRAARIPPSIAFRSDA